MCAASVAQLASAACQLATMTHVVVDVSSWSILVVVLPRLQLCSLALQMDQHCKLSCQKCRNVTMEELLTDLDANPEGRHHRPLRGDREGFGLRGGYLSSKTHSCSHSCSHPPVARRYALISAAL